MTSDEIKAIREGLGLTQAQLAQLLGVHPITISKWERGVAPPQPYHAALLSSFRAARRRSPDVGSFVIGLLVGAGVGVALYHLLKAAHEDGDE